MKHIKALHILREYSIRKQMLLGFLSIIILVGFMGGVAFVQSGKINTEVDLMFNEITPKRNAISSIRLGIMDQIRTTEEYAGDFMSLKEAKEELAEVQERIDANIQKLKNGSSKDNSIVSPKSLISLKKVLDEGGALREEIINIKIADQKANTSSEKGAMGTELREKLEEFDEYVENTNEITELIIEMTASSENKSRTSILQYVEIGQRVNLVVFILVIIMSLFVSIVVSGLISNAITIARDVAIGVSRGNMNIKIDTSGNNEIAELMQAIDEMRASLKIIMRDYKKAFKKNAPKGK